MNNPQHTHTGGCLCGAVRYSISGPIRDVVICHCSMCQKLHGAAGAHSKAHKSDIIFSEQSGLTWYASSARARRGFCKKCGSSLFWEPTNQSTMGILAGSLDDSSMLKTIGHIFTEEKCEFTEIPDHSLQFAGSSDGELEGDAL